MQNSNMYNMEDIWTLWTQDQFKFEDLLPYIYNTVRHNKVLMVINKSKVKPNV